MAELGTWKDKVSITKKNWKKKKNDFEGEKFRSPSLYMLGFRCVKNPWNCKRRAWVLRGQPAWEMGTWGSSVYM